MAVALEGLVVPNTVMHTPVDALLAAGLTFAGLPAALAVVKLTTHNTLEVISLAVAEPFRRLGLARQLLLWLQSETQRLGVQSLTLSYPLAHASTSAMGRLTADWHHSPGLRLVHLNRTGGAALVQMLTPLANRWLRSGRYALVHWQAMDSELQHRLDLRQQQAPSWAWSATADAALGQLDTRISQVLLDRQSVVGWLVAHRVGRSLLRVSQWWIIPEWRGHGLALLLLHQAVVDALKAQPSYLSGCFGVATSNAKMLNISHRYLEPLATSVQSNQRVSWSCP